MIDFVGDRAIYRQVADHLKERIAAGERLPSTARIGQEYGVGVGTVKRSLAVLVGDGLIVVRRGYGPEVIARPGETPEVETVRLYRGSKISVRLPTEADRRELEIPLPLMTPVIEVTMGVRSWRYLADRTEFTSA